MNQHALQVLQLAEALESVASLATSAAGRAGVRALRPSTRAGEVEEELRAVAEAAGLLRRQPEWGMPALPELGDALHRLRVEGSVWEGAELRSAATLMASGAAARAFLREQEEVPRLHALVEGMWDAPPLRAEVVRAIGEEGEVLDDASPLLARLRREIRTLRGRLVRRLEDYMASLPPEHRVSDASVTVREGRYVIPVRREGRGSVGGLVHGESATGATLFVEPPLALEHMNRLRELEGEEEREVRRILRELTGRLRPHREELGALLEALTRLDTLYARGRYAARHDAVRPEILPPGGALRVVRGRHPLLLAQGGAVVPFDLALEPEQRTLLVSGPNTGGKTVLLKAVGLIALLAQSGVIPPVGEGTRLPLFLELFADIGDEQSIEASLSTFSAHLRNLAETLGGADGASLVLVDEIGSGTDPTEGAALARAILLELTGRGSLTVATTHLGQLKLLASEDPRVVNASLEFDAERLEPTYRLLVGVPGRSYGLAIARRLGLPAGLLAEAEAALPEGERDVGRLLLELEARERQLAARLEEATAREAESARRLEEAEARHAELAARAEDAERRARQQARDLLLGARQEVERAIQEVRGAASAEALEEAARGARRRVEEAARRQREKAPAPQRSAPRAPQRRASAPLAEGERVRVLSLGRTGTVLELRDDRATVETGGMRLQLPVGDLEPAPEEEGGRTEPRRTVARTSFEADARTEVDLRGMRVDEMELALGRALDAAVVSGLPVLRVIHGLGTGVLRARVGEMVAADPRVASARAGERGEGGLGVTVVELR